MTSSITIGPFIAGEHPPPLAYTFEDANGVPINLTGYSAKLVLTEIDGLPSTADAAVTTPAEGEVTYTWAEGDLATPGVYEAVIWAGNGGTTRFASLPIRFVVDDAGTTPDI
jgi:hypothetical protein